MSSDAAAPEAKIQLDVLKYIKKIQSRNGVRDGQYIRYHQYCTRRLHRLRVSLALTTKSSKYKPSPLSTDQFTSSLHLTIPLLLAERAWAYAMQMQADIPDLEDGDKSKRRYHLVRRLVRASKFASELESVASSVADEVTQLQATAYAAWLKGTVALEKENWSDALTNFNSASAIFTQLAGVSDLEVAALCTERSTQIKLYQTFCSNKLKRIDPDAAALLSMQSGSTDAMFQAKLNAVLESSLKSQATVMQTIEWQAKVYKVKNERTRVLLLEASSVTKQLQSATDDVDMGDDADMTDNSGGQQSQSSVLNKLIGLYDDVLLTIRADIREVTSVKVKTAVLEDGLTQLQGLQQYVNYLKAQAQLIKNTATATMLRARFHSQSRKQHIQASSLVTVYDRLLQTLTDLFESADVDNNAQLRQTLETRRQGFLGVRVFYLALAYAQHEQMAEAMALLQRSKQYMEATLKALEVLQGSVEADSAFTVTRDVEAEVLQLRTVLAGLPAELVRVKARTIASNESIRAQLAASSIDESAKTVVHANTNTPLLNRLDAFDAGVAGQQHNLLAFPAPLVAVPAKPFLFDLAANSLEYPDIASGLANRVGSQKPTASSTTTTNNTDATPEDNSGSKTFWGRLWG